MSQASEQIARQYASAVINKKEWGSIIYNVKDKAFGAEGDGKTDDTKAIQSAIDTANTAGGGTVYFPPGKYRVTGVINLRANVKLSGQGTIYIDFTGSSVISAQGTIGSTIAISANVAEGDLTISVASTTGLTVGGYVQLANPRHDGYRYPRTFYKVKTLTATLITVETPISIPYTTADVCTVAPISFMENVSIDGLTFSCSGTSNIRYLIDFNATKDAMIHDIIIKGHQRPSNPTDLRSVSIENSYNVLIEHVTKYGRADETLDAGDMIDFIGVEKGTIVNCVGIGVSFGISNWRCMGNTILNNKIQGIRSNGHRGIKIVGSYYLSISQNLIQSTDAGIKVEDCSRCLINENRLLDCGIATIGSSGINCASAFSGDYQFLHIRGNIIKRQTGLGIYVDSTYQKPLIADNVTEYTTSFGILSDAVASIIDRNRVFEYANTMGIRFLPSQSIVTRNNVYAADVAQKSFGMGSSTGITDCIFTENIATNNVLDTTYDFEAIGVFCKNRLNGMPLMNQISSAKAYKPNGQFINQNTWTKIDYTTEVYDNKNEYNATLSRFTALHDGTYIVTAGVYVSALVNQERSYMSVYKNGSISDSLFDSPASGTGQARMSGTTQIQLNAGDYIEIWTFVPTSTTLGDGLNGSFLVVTRIA